MEGTENGTGKASANSAPPESEEEPVIGPGPAPKARAKRPLQFEQAYLDALPSANMYAISLYVYFQLLHLSVF